MKSFAFQQNRVLSLIFVFVFTLSQIIPSVAFGNSVASSQEAAPLAEAVYTGETTAQVDSSKQSLSDIITSTSGLEQGDKTLFTSTDLEEEKKKLEDQDQSDNTANNTKKEVFVALVDKPKAKPEGQLKEVLDKLEAIEKAITADNGRKAKTRAQFQKELFDAWKLHMIKTGQKGFADMPKLFDLLKNRNAALKKAGNKAASTKFQRAVVQIIHEFVTRALVRQIIAGDNATQKALQKMGYNGTEELGIPTLGLQYKCGNCVVAAFYTYALLKALDIDGNPIDVRVAFNGTTFFHKALMVSFEDGSRAVVDWGSASVGQGAVANPPGKRFNGIFHKGLPPGAKHHLEIGVLKNGKYTRMSGLKALTEKGVTGLNGYDNIVGEVLASYGQDLQEQGDDASKVTDKVKLWKRARTFLSSAIKMDSNLYVAHEKLATTLINLVDFDEVAKADLKGVLDTARTSLTKFKTLDVDNAGKAKIPAIDYVLGMVYARYVMKGVDQANHAQHLKDAKKQFDLVLNNATVPQFVKGWAYWGRAYVYAKQGNGAAAVADLKKGMAIDPAAPFAKKIAEAVKDAMSVSSLPIQFGDGLNLASFEDSLSWKESLKEAFLGDLGHSAGHDYFTSTFDQIDSYSEPSEVDWDEFIGLLGDDYDTLLEDQDKDLDELLKLFEDNGYLV